MKLSTYFNPKLQKLILIASLFAFGTYCNAAPVPATAKFRSVIYDATTKHFIAVGDADLMAVSTDGRHWDYHKVVPQNNTRASGISYNDVFFGDNQTLYILSQSEDLLKRESASLTDAGQWKFTKVVQNGYMHSEDLESMIQIPITAEYRDKTKTPIVLRTFFLQRVGNQEENIGLKNLYRQDLKFLTSTSEASLYETIIKLKGGKSLHNLAVSIQELKEGQLSNTVTICDGNNLLYSTDWGQHFKTIQDSEACQFEAVTSRQLGMPIIEVIFDPKTEGSSVCDLSAQPSPRCTPVPAMTGHHAEAVAATAHGAAVAVSDDDGSLHKTKVITGNIADTGVFTVNSSSAEFAVARRTCAATNNDHLTVMLGEDNKVLLSTDGRTWNIQPMLAR